MRIDLDKLKKLGTRLIAELKPLIEAGSWFPFPAHAALPIAYGKILRITK